MEPLADRGLVTLVAFVAYMGVVWWAYREKSRARFEEDAWLPFEEDERAPAAQGGTPPASGGKAMR